MPETFAAVLTGAVVGFPASFAALRLGRRFDLLDHPGAIKPHARAVPFTGGSAMLLAILVGGVALGVAPAILFGACLTWLIGFADDRSRLRPSVKAAALVAPLLLAAIGIGLSSAAAVLAIALGIVMVNAFNVIDGLDGLAAGVALVSLLPLLVVATPPSVLAALAWGAVLAFLAFNLHPARLFMGDEGSLLLGYVLWVVPLSIVARQPSLDAVLFAVLLWGFPLVNAIFVVSARLRAGRSPLAGDRNHLYDVLYRRFGLAGALAICWGIGAVCAALAAAVWS